MWPLSRRTPTPSQSDRELAQRLLDQAQLLNQMAARLLRLDSASTSSPPSTASSSSTSRPRVRGLESVSILDRETLYQQDQQRASQVVPEYKVEPEPIDHSEGTRQSRGGVSGGFAPPPPTDA